MLRFLLPCLLFALSASAHAQTTFGRWAEDLVDSSGVGSPASALGSPDGELASVSSTPGSFATYGTFSAPGVAYSPSSLAALLGVSASTLAGADFVAFEYNGSPGIKFEGSVWTFKSGASEETITYTEGVAGGAVLATGDIAVASYDSFFSLSTPSLPAAGRYAYVLFDLAVANPLAGDFTARIAKGTGIDAGTPDPDAMAVLTAVPEPGTYAMLLAGLAALGFVARKRARS